MKTKVIALIALAGLFSAGTAISAESEPTGARPFMGVLLDPAPLPELLTKHLGLSSGQGIRVRNVQRHSPADQAGLEQDDIIIGFGDDEVDDNKRFVDAVREAGVGTEVSLQIIHLGKRKTVEIKLRAFDGEFDWKYPREPEAVQSWRPGRLFRLRPGEEDWTEILRDHIPPDIDVDIKKFFNELHTYHHTNGDSYTITIEGSPDDEDSTITVRIDDDEYTTTIKEIDKLPEKYREAAEQAVESARKASGKKRFGRRFSVPSWQPPFGRRDEMFDKIQQQLRELRARLEENEQRYRESLEKLEEYYHRFSPKRDENDSKKPDESAQPEDKEEQRV